MDTWKICLTCVLVTLGLVTAAQAQNSVAGRVVDKRTGTPISEVHVFIQPLGGPALKADQTRKDGLYLISVPKSISKYVIRFSSQPQYFDGLDCGDEDACVGIANKSEQLKRPDMELSPFSSTAGMSAEQLRKLIERQDRIIQFGDTTKTPGLREMGVDNLLLIKRMNDDGIKAERISLEERIRISDLLDGSAKKIRSPTTANAEKPVKEKVPRR